MNIVRKTGEYEKTTFADETVRAFVPAALPPIPPLVLDPARLQLAKSALSKLDQLRLMVPSIDWFIYSFARTEAVMSSQIEGTQTTLVDLFAAEAVPTGSPDLEDVFNYLGALDHARGQLHDPKGLPLSMRLLDETHAELMKGVRGSKSAPGQIRRTQNWIGGSRPGNAVFVPPPPQRLPELLSALERYMHVDDDVDPLVRIGLLHVQFETIHPYLDGNGRLGRLLITLLLEHWRLLTEPLLYPSLFLKQNRDEYYRRLTAVRTEGDWEGWTDFFLSVIAEAAETASTAIGQLFTIVNDDRTRVIEAAHATSTIRLFARLPRNPFVSIARAASLLETSRTTASRAIDELVMLGVLEPDTERLRDRTFHYSRYVSYLRRGTDLDPSED
jgi:Fic family protein